MNYSTFYESIVKVVYIESSVAHGEVAQRLLRRLPRVRTRIVDGPHAVAPSDRRGTTLYLTPHRGAAVARCPGSKGHLCCNYLTVDLYSGCPIGCTYCIMRSYLNFSPVAIVAEPRPIIDAIVRVAEANPDTMIRVGSGETGDSLLFDPLCELSRPIVSALAEHKNVFFEMKTKTDLVDHLLDIERKGNAVVGFSVGPQTVIDGEEGTAVSLEARLQAARRAACAGFMVSFHFDPMFYRPDWQELYFPVADALARFRNDRVAWISLGTFRYPPQLKECVAPRAYLYGEFVRSVDGKYRYLQRVRREMYRIMRERILAAVRTPVYLCMESEAVWNRAFGAAPGQLDAVATLFKRPEL